MMLATVRANNANSESRLTKLEHCDETMDIRLNTIDLATALNTKSCDITNGNITSIKKDIKGIDETLVKILIKLGN